MAGEPALDKVLTALRQVIAAALPDATVDVDRPDDDAYGNAELANGAVNIIHTGTSFELLDYGTTLHRASIDLDMIVETKAASTLGARLRILEADLIDALWADRTLGGVAQDIIPQSSGGGEDVRSDEGARPLSLQILFLTPLGDHRTVIGASGLIP